MKKIFLRKKVNLSVTVSLSKYYRIDRKSERTMRFIYTY